MRLLQSQIGFAEALPSAFLLVLLFPSAVQFLFWRQDLTMEPMAAGEILILLTQSPACRGARHTPSRSTLLNAGNVCLFPFVRIAPNFPCDSYIACSVVLFGSHVFATFPVRFLLNSSFSPLGLEKILAVISCVLNLTSASFSRLFHMHLRNDVGFFFF